MAFFQDGSGSGGSLNVPDDHRFATTAERDAAIPSPEEGEQCTVQSSVPQYHLLQEYRSGAWVDITYIIEGPQGPEGPEGPEGPAGGKLPHKDLDVDIYGDMNASEWIAEGNFVYAFNNPKLSDLSNSPANDYDYGNDPDRTFSIVHGEQTVNTHDGKTYVTRTFIINESDRPKAYNREGYIEDNTFDNCPWQPINGLVVSKKLTDGSYQKVPSGFMKFGGGLKPVFDGETTTVNAVAPFSEVVEIFDNAQVSSPEDNKTYVYSTVDLKADHEFWLNLDPADVVEGYTVSVAVAPTSMSSITLFMGKSKELKAPILPGSTIVIKRLTGESQFRIFKSAGGVFLNIDSFYLDLAPENWQDQPINTYFVAEGTYKNISSKVDGKTGKMIAQVINTDVQNNPNSMIVHVYTLVSGEDSINGLQFKRVADTKENFLNAKLVPLDQAGEAVVDSSNPLEVIAKDGSNHDMIAINDDDDVVVGSRSSTINSLALATHARHIIAYHSNDDGTEVYDTLAFASDLTNIASRGKRTIWVRGLTYEITEEDIQNDIIIQCDASLKDSDGNYSLTVTFPTLSVMTKHYWIPGVNDDQQSFLPKITDLEIKCWIDPEDIHEGIHRLYLKSADNAFGWETATSIDAYEGCYMEREHDATTKSTLYEFNFMKIEIGGSTTGPMKGYVLQSARADEVFSIGSDSPTATVDVAHDWNDTQEITAEDIANALGKVQSENISSHTDNLGPSSLSATTFKVQRPESEGKSTSPFAYTFFAFPQDFFTDEDGNLSEPTMVNTGSGNSSSWIVSTVVVDEVNYRVMVSPSRNSAPLLPSAKLVQPGVLRK